MRLGFSVKSMARPELRSHDSRRWQSGPHLSVSLAYLRDILTYLSEARIRMYRMASELAPYATHPDLPSFGHQAEECAGELAEIGRMATSFGVRLSFHPSQHVVLNSPDPDIVSRSCSEVVHLAGMLDAMQLGADAVVVVHLGGSYGDHRGALGRFARSWWGLPCKPRGRLALENDDVRFSVSDTLRVHQETGIPLVFDNLHHRLHNPDGVPVRDALAACLATWPEPARPKVHFSSPRTEWLVEGAGGADPSIRRTRWTHHADFVHPFEFIDFCRMALDLRPFDAMLEVRARDIALRQLRTDVRRFAPDLVQHISE